MEILDALATISKPAPPRRGQTNNAAALAYAESALHAVQRSILADGRVQTLQHVAAPIAHLDVMPDPFGLAGHPLIGMAGDPGAYSTVPRPLEIGK